MLNDILAKLNVLSPEDKMALIKETEQVLKGIKWIPSPGPQQDAYFSKADVLLYGGQAGGGKSSLLLGLALTQHERSLIMRRQYGDLNALTDEICRLNGTRDGFNASPPPRLRISPSAKFESGQLVEFGAAQLPGSEQSFMGNPHDLLGFDEATQFLESQIRFLQGWVRSVRPNQRTRTILATNPPIKAEGQWVIGMFRPWLDLTHSKPAKHGELRWYCRTPDGQEIEVEGPGWPSEEEAKAYSKIPHVLDGHELLPVSRTFIHASLSDNPFLVDTDYQSRLDNMPEPYRSAIRDGNFMAARKDGDYQLFPTDWIRQAQARWTPKPPKGIPMCAMGVDIAQGGGDNTVIAVRYDGWFDHLSVHPGKSTPTGAEVAGLIVSKLRDEAKVILDMGGAYGQSTMDHLRNGIGIEPVPYRGILKTSQKSLNHYGFHNTRAQAYWRFREALDPDKREGSSIALPDDPELVAELTSVEFEIDHRGIKITSKEDVKDKLQRSPDKADAVIMAWYAGWKSLGRPEDWREYADPKKKKKRPEVIRSLLGNRRYG